MAIDYKQWAKNLLARGNLSFGESIYWQRVELNLGMIELSRLTNISVEQLMRLQAGKTFDISTYAGESLAHNQAIALINEAFANVRAKQAPE